MRKVLFMAVLMLDLFSCKNKIENGGSSGGEDIQQVEVKLSLGGELDIVGELMLVSRASSRDIIAVQVYQRSSDVGSKYKPYSYGLWSDLADISVKLNKGYTYRFEVTVLPQGMEMVAVNETNGSFRQPFTVLGTGGDSRIGNQFVYSNSNMFSGICLGSTALKNDKGYTIYGRPVGDRYYGELTDVVVTEKTQINIEAKRVVFGLTYDIKYFNEGVIKVTMTGTPDVILTPEAFATEQTLITMQGSAADPAAWTSDNYSEFIQLSAYWIHPGGEEVKIATREHNFKRRTVYKLSLDLSQLEPVGQFGISLESEELNDGGVI